MADKLSQLKERADLIWNLYGCRSLMGWDHQVMMPQGGGPARANQMATLERVTHEMLTDDRFRALLEQAEAEVAGKPEDDIDRCYVKAVRRKHDRYAKIPSQLVEELARATNHALDVWVQAKKTSDFATFKPHLGKVIELCRQVADHRGYPEHPYDAMLEEWEPGMLTSRVKSIFDGLRPGLVSLVERITHSAHPPSTSILRQRFDGEAQRRFVRYIVPTIGFNMTCGRIDESAHPFCSSNTSLDVRLTTRVREDLVPQALFGGLHEAGHGLYEQGSPPEWNGTPLKGGCSLGVHESQSRLWENLVGRSRAFWKHHFPRMRDHFPQQLSGFSAEDWYRAINEVRPSLIRVEADEVTYNLHIMLRFEIETQLMDGSLKVDDIPEAWNSRIKSYLGIEVPDHAHGCMQDIHWADGLVGYFPTYSIGNILASQWWELIEKAVPDVDERLSRGDCRAVLDWLRTHIHQHGSKFTPVELIHKVTGHELDYHPFLNYLDRKFSDIYQLESRIPALT